MKRVAVSAAVVLLISNVAHADPTKWELLDDQFNVIGTFLLDLDTQATSNAEIYGQIGRYTISSSFTFLNSSGFVGPYPVANYFKFFSVEAGKAYTQDLGGGEYHQIRVNDSAIDIGTLGVLAPGGGPYEAFIHEIYNYDEISVLCSYYEEVYDDEGNYIGQGPCVLYDTFASYNIESGDWHEGYYLRSARTPAIVEVPLPATTWLLPILLAGVGARRIRRKSRSGACTPSLLVAAKDLVTV